jgi:hypothetical protein
MKASKAAAERASQPNHEQNTEAKVVYDSIHHVWTRGGVYIPINDCKVNNTELDNVI